VLQMSTNKEWGHSHPNNPIQSCTNPIQYTDVSNPCPTLQHLQHDTVLSCL